MPVQHDLSVAPYHDDYDDSKNYYRVLVKPGFSVQTREFNQIQSIFQGQIESFADHVFKNGTIVSGCGIKFDPQFSYVKLTDTDGDGNDVDPEDLTDLMVKNANNVTGIILEGLSGFETQAPNLNTIYVRYISSGDDKITKTFAADQLLTVYDNTAPVESIVVNAGGSSFANSDQVQILPALTINVTSGSFIAGANVSQTIGANTANAIIVSIANVTNSNNKVIVVKPYNADLSNTSLSAQKWSFVANATISTDGGSVANVVSVLGSAASARIITDGSGVITNVVMTGSGSGYFTVPWVTVRTNSTAVASAFTLTARTYRKLLTVAPSNTTPVGVGYALSVSDGVIYQEGTFIRVHPQRVIVKRYDNTPNGLIVGFEQNTSIVNASIDTTLLDNATGEPNFAAPGADRLKIVPTLRVVSNTAEFNSNTFFSIVEFYDGNPAKQVKMTQYSAIGDELARRTYDSQGDFVVQPFYLGSRDQNPLSTNNFNVLIGPGLAYVNGNRIETFYDTTVPTKRGIATKQDRSKTGSFSIGNYVKVTEVGGRPAFKAGEKVELRANTVTFMTVSGNGTGGYTSISSAANTAAGAILGTARVRGIQLDDGEIGTNTAIYKVYLFDINMASGKSFGDVRSIIMSETSRQFVADIVRDVNPITNTSSAVIKEPQFNTLVFKTGRSSVSHANNVSYLYQTTNNYTYANNGVVTITLTGPTETHPYSPSSNLTVTQLESIIVIPVANIETTTTAATLDLRAGNATSLPIVNSSADWPSEISVGDHLRIVNASANTYMRVEGVINARAIFVSSNVNFGSGTAYAFRLPQDIVVPVERAYRSANLDGTGKTLTLRLPVFTSTNSLADGNVAVCFNIERSDESPTSKTVNRNVAVKLQLSNAVSNTVGPWSLGIPDVFRLKSVFKVTTDQVAGCTIGAGGSGYINAETLSFSGGGGSGAAGYVSTNSTGGITNVTITAHGSGYGSAPGVTINTAGGTAGSLTAVLHTAATINTNSEDVTGAFFVDSGQQAGFYGLSKLVRSPGAASAAVTLNANTILLALVDCFTISSFGGYFNRESYPINDTTPLANSTSTINTVEVPEFRSTYDQKLYFDLIDSLDFRPYIANTANVTANVAAAHINPSDTVTMSAAEKYWPVPNDDYAFGVDFYLGYTATVTVDDAGSFVVIKGMDSERPLDPPDAPGGVMVINYMSVPPYPTIPLVPDSTVLDFLDKRLGNATGVITTRLQNHLVKVLEDTTKIMDRNQPIRYTMEDIGNLDRRIKILEYYTSLSLLEANVVNLAIPSSGNAALGRFKNGFFVEGFDNMDTADQNNLEFTAEIDEGASRLISGKDSLKLNIQFNLSPFIANGSVNPTSDWIASIHRFNENGQELLAADASANTFDTGRIATMPYTEETVVDQQIYDGVTSIPIVPTGFSGVMDVNEVSFDVLGILVHNGRPRNL